MKKTILFLIISSLFLTFPLFANITSVTVTPATPTALSNGNSYYLAGVQPTVNGYRFRVQASDPLATNQAYWGGGNIVLRISDGALNFLEITIPIATGVPAKNPVADASSITVTNNTAGWANLDYQIDITFAWNTAEYAAGINNVIATVNETTNLSSLSDTKSFNFGVCSSIRVANFAQNQDGLGVVPGVAADGYVNPWHNDFRVTGTIVYNVTGATVSDAIVTVDPGEISAANQITLLLDGGPTAILNGGTTTNFRFTVTNAIGLTLGNHGWRMRATMVTGAAVEESPNVAPYYLALNCDRVQITAITIINGGGTPVAPFYRNVNVPGTQIQVTAQLENGGGAMIGNTTVTVRNVNQNYYFNVSILSGQNIGVRNVPTPNNTDFAAGTTQETNYQIVYITGGAYGDSAPPGEGIPPLIPPAPAFGQNGQNRILTPLDGGAFANTPAYDIRVYWDRNDPPGNNIAGAVFTGWGGFLKDAISFTLNWQPVTALPDPPWDGDFYTYRIYYKLSSSPTWIIVDRSTPNYGPAQTYDLSNPATASAVIPGLQPFRNYDYYITAVDVFGQEVAHPLNSTSNACYNRTSVFNTPVDNGYDRILTDPTSLGITLTDGITQYINSQFETVGIINATSRPLRKSSIRVSIYIVTGEDLPDSVNIILAQDNGSGTGDAPATNLENGGALTSIPHEKISCSKSAPNTWQGYIPSTNQFLTEGNYCRFIIESIRNGNPTYTDRNSFTDGNPNNYEYTFMVSTPTKFTPWPTRVLNNVITDKNPLCYPSYYLSDDAYVTIKAYDVKGRPVATLLENGFRKGGQNIKEGGWNGDNKARRKLGVGLYYLRFEAKRARDGKMILNETEKVVMAK